MVYNSCSLSIISFWISLAFRVSGFDAAMCIDNCLPNISTSWLLVFDSMDTTTPSLETLSLITECWYI